MKGEKPTTVVPPLGKQSAAPKPAEADQGSKEVAEFLTQLAKTPQKPAGHRGRLIFAMDATASREPSWDTACHLHAEMFTATEASGQLSVQLCHYRGFGSFNASPWCDSPSSLLTEMSAVRCLGGHTQIAKVLRHIQAEHRQRPVQAAVFVGDAMEEDPDLLCHLAGELGVLGIPLFIFQEGRQPEVERVFQQMASLSGGAWAPFDLGSAAQLKALLSAVAVYATGGAEALAHFSKQAGKAVALLTQQLGKQ